MTSVFGILNVTRDSFSDGGMWLEPWAAIARGRDLHAAGADVIDVGAESTSPGAEQVPAAVEIARLAPVVRALQAASIAVSIDTSKPEVMAAMGLMGVDWLNDVSGFRSDAAVAAAAATNARLVVMFSRSKGPRAEQIDRDADGLLEEIEGFSCSASPLSLAPVSSALASFLIQAWVTFLAPVQSQACVCCAICLACANLVFRC